MLTLSVFSTWSIITTCFVLLLIYMQYNLLSLKVLSYFSDKDCSLQPLEAHQIVRKVFQHYNTAIPSSAPVERQFSTAGLIETPRRNKLSDSPFEKSILLKMNQSIFWIEILWYVITFSRFSISRNFNTNWVKVSLMILWF